MRQKCVPPKKYFLSFNFLSAYPWGSWDVASFSPLRGCGGYWGQIQFTLWAKARGPWMSRQLIARPLLMAVADTQGANCTSGATLGFSILLKATLTCSSGPPSLVHQLYPLSYTHKDDYICVFRFKYDLTKYSFYTLDSLRSAVVRWNTTLYSNRQHTHCRSLPSSCGRDTGTGLQQVALRAP